MRFKFKFLKNFKGNSFLYIIKEIGNLNEVSLPDTWGHNHSQEGKCLSEN